jgi:ABC-2 type transport system permease protein
VARILRLWAVHAKLDLVLLTRSPRLFAAYFVSDLIVAAGGATGAVFLLANRFDGVGTWSRAQLVFMLGYSIVVPVGWIFGYNVLYVSRRIGRGQLDHTLVQPQPMWRSFLTEGFAPVQGVAALLPGIVVVWWSLPRLPVEVTLGWAALFVLNQAATCAVVLAVSFTAGTLAFWAPRGAEEISSSTNDFFFSLKVFPLDGVGRPARVALVGIVPVGLFAWVPSRYLAGVDPRLWVAFATPAGAVVLGAVAFLVFRQGVKHYGRTGSQRYSGWGHRS